MKLAEKLRAIALLAALVPACLASNQAIAQLAPIKVAFSGKLDGSMAPLLLAIDRGLFRSENIDVVLEQTNGAADPLTRVANGSADIVIADINALARLRAQTPTTPAKAVFIIFNKPAYAVIGRKSRNVMSPKDLEGKKIGAPAQAPSLPFWKTFAQNAGFDPGKATLETIGAPVREPMLAAGQVDAVLGSAFTSLVDLKDRGVVAEDIVVMPMADYGIKAYGQAFIVNEKFAAEKPELVKGFLHAYTKALKETIKDPGRAIDVVVKRTENSRKETELERLRLALRSHILTSEVKANGLGAADPMRLEAGIEQMAGVADLKNKPTADEIFDPSFLPPAAERKVQ